ncbi:MAG: methionyl-tRNA formyltransferase [Acidaminococcaceae bacterium]
MRILFMGSPEFAVDSLAALVNSSHEVLAVVTQPDRPKGRGQKLIMTAVKAYALEQNLPVLQPAKISTPEFMTTVQNLAPDLIVVAAFGQFLSKKMLELPTYGCINVHASLLPRYRGAAPIHYAILQGEQEAGVTIMQMDVGMDTGAMLAKASVPVTPNMTMGELHDELKVLGADLLLKVIEMIEAKTLVPEIQNNVQATYASLLTRAMEKIDWAQPALNIHNKVRGFNPWPGTYTQLPNGKVLKLWQTRVLADSYPQVKPGTVVTLEKDYFVVACGQQSLAVLEVQPESKKRMSAGVFSNGHGIQVGDVFIVEV